MLSGVIELVKERVLLFQSMQRFLNFYQGIPRMICLCPRLATMRSMSLESWGKIMQV